MRTRRSYFPPTSTIPRHSRIQTTNVVEPEFRTIVEMADNRTIAQMLQAPIEGYEDAIVVPSINANNFELKQTLINLVPSNQFTGRQDPHNHLRFSNKVTSTFRHPEESKVDESELGKPELDKLEVGFDLVKLLGKMGFFLGCSPEDYGFLDSYFALSAVISASEVEVIELDDSLRWPEVSQSLWMLTKIGDFILELRDHGRWKIFPEKHFGHLLKKIRAIGPPRPFKDGWHISSIVRRSGTGGSPFPSAAISELFKRVGSVRDLLRIVSSGLSRYGKRFLADERMLMHQK
uniref:Reverse transcriptase domain-containing protein n=1 Tax=Tanacetum cinerariifolium TaxID=118510 RepID=A0A6L2MTR3_TANCI|nr:reverse transcriptase domain-containing protein [Tanacetum cinerariifolium]